MHPKNSPPTQGSALLLVLWSLVLLSVSVFGVVEMVEASVSHSSHLELESQARALALSGLAVAMYPNLARNDSLLHQEPFPGQTWRATIEAEGGRLNLNYILSTEHREILSRLFEIWGMKKADADSVADCLYDWVTPGDKRSDYGAKAADYERANLPQRPTGRPFVSLDEVEQVMGMDMVEKVKPDWKDSFTLWSDGPLDVNEASADLLSALFDIPESQSSAWVEIRNGADGVVGTTDDKPAVGAGELKDQLGLNADTLSSLTQEISFKDSIRRVESRGEVNHVHLTVTAVTRLGSYPPEYLLWTEL